MSKTQVILTMSVLLLLLGGVGYTTYKIGHKVGYAKGVTDVKEITDEIINTLEIKDRLNEERNKIQEKIINIYKERTKENTDGNN